MIFMVESFIKFSLTEELHFKLTELSQFNEHFCSPSVSHICKSVRNIGLTKGLSFILEFNSLTTKKHTQQNVRLQIFKNVKSKLYHIEN